MSDLAPETGPDARPRPRFGEYATPEEQRARMRQPGAAGPGEAGAAPAQPPRHPTSAPGPAGTPAAAARPRLWDRVLTFGLLGYGLFTVLTSIPSAVDYGSFASTFLGILGVDQSLADPSAGRGWGLAAALVLGVGWIAAFGLGWLSLRAGRISFWIPLVVGILCNVVSSLLLIVPLMNDPAVWSALQDALLGGAG